MKLIRECIKLKGMHELIPLIEAAKQRCAKTHSALAGIEQRTKPKINERLVELELRKERQRFLRQDKSLARSLDNVARMRSILLGKKVRNRELMRLRKELQAARYQGLTEQVASGRSHSRQRKFKTIRWSQGG